jgi:hypothetical protein
MGAPEKHGVKFGAAIMNERSVTLMPAIFGCQEFFSADELRLSNRSDFFNDSKFPGSP